MFTERVYWHHPAELRRSSRATTLRSGRWPKSSPHLASFGRSYGSADQSPSPSYLFDGYPADHGRVHARGVVRSDGGDRVVAGTAGGEGWRRRRGYGTARGRIDWICCCQKHRDGQAAESQTSSQTIGSAARFVNASFFGTIHARANSPTFLVLKPRYGGRVGLRSSENGGEFPRIRPIAIALVVRSG